MNNQRIEFRIGIVVLVALATLVFMVVWFGKQSIVNFGDEYTLKIRFQATPGVKVNTPVIKNGVQIGRVSKIDLVDEDREVEVSILLPKERKVYTNEECRVRQTMIMGDSTLEFVRKKKFTGPIEVLPADAPPQVGGAALDLLGGFSNIEGDLQKAITNVSNTAETMSTFIDRINTFVGSPEELKRRQAEIQSTMAEMSETMRSVHKLADGAGNLFNDPTFQANAKKIVQDLPDILDRSRNMLKDSEVFLKEFRTTMARGSQTLDKVDQGLDKVDRGLDEFVNGMTEIRSFTKQLGSNGVDTLQSIQSTIKKVDAFVSDLSSLMSGIAGSDTPLLQRFMQPEVAANIQATVENIRSITEQFDLLLRNDVKPITHNVKIITDKVARDPSVFIRNLIRKPPPIKNGLPIWGDGLGSDTLSVDCFDLGPFHEGTIYQEEIPMIEQRTPYEPMSPPLARQRSATFSSRIASFFSAPKPVVSVKPSQKMQPSGPILEEPENSYRPEDDGDAPPLALQPPSLEPPSLQSPSLELPNLQSPNPQSSSPAPEEKIPAEGRVVCVDPRYVDAETPTPYRQMSYSVEAVQTPKLVFSK